MKALKLSPKYIKYKFFFKRKIKNNFILRPFVKSLQYGSYGLMSTENFKVTYKEMESVRISISKQYKKFTKIWLRFRFDIPLTQKPQVRMGKGKGRISSWVCNISKGSIILEIDNLPFNESYKVLKLAAQKLPGSISIVFR